MSRIGSYPIPKPEDVEVAVSGKNEISVKGPKGEVSELIDPSMKVQEEDGQIYVQRPNNSKRSKSYHGLYRSLINNMIKGVKEGFTKELELVGVGYRVKLESDNVLELNVGYSHLVYFVLPEEVSASVKTEKGENPKITLESFDKQLLGQVAAKIKSLRPVEPYKGKGVRIKGEFVRSKAGKSASK